MIGLALLIGAALIAGCYQAYRWIKADPMYRVAIRGASRGRGRPGPYWIVVRRKRIDDIDRARGHGEIPGVDNR